MVLKLAGLVFVVFVWRSCWSFYIPEGSPVAYCTEEERRLKSCKPKIKLFVNRLTSVDSMINYAFSSFDFCQKPGKRNSQYGNLGQVISGERIEESAYNISFKVPLKCQLLCTKEYEKKNVEDIKKLDFLKNSISLNYQNHWIIDNMPVTWCYDVTDPERKYCSTGFPIGCYVTADGQARDACVTSTKFNQADTHYVFNHVDITITYHSGAGEDWVGARLLSAKLVPRSIKHDKPTDCNAENVLGIPNSKNVNIKIHYTYSVKFEENNNLKWASRWDYILQSMTDTTIQWFSIMNSLFFLVFLSAALVSIVWRILRKKDARYNQFGIGDLEFDDHIMFGWRSIHGDVFRAPSQGKLLSVWLGSGSQIFFMTFITLVVGNLGFLSPANRGALVTCALVSFACLGFVGGYVSTRFYKMFSGNSWTAIALFSSFFVPGVIFTMFVIINIVLWKEGSSSVIPLTTLLVLLALWFGVDVPLTFLGAYLGFKKPTIGHPHTTNRIPRMIPGRKCWSCSGPLCSIHLGGILPYLCIFNPLFFAMNSIWLHQIYYNFGFLLLVFLILIFTIGECAVLLCYFQLKAEDYHWWWRSFLTGGCTAFYFFLYAIHFFYSKLTISGTASTFLYFGYTFIMFLLFFLFSGTFGCMACFFFNRKIYCTFEITKM